MRNEVLAKLPSPRLRAYVVWTSILPSDDGAAAASATTDLLPDDDRVASFWDGDRGLALDLGKQLAIPATSRPSAVAWDVYVLYAPGASWGSPPSFWMHQLEAMEPAKAPLFDAAVLRQRLEGLLP